jgi:hypothetical protein
MRNDKYILDGHTPVPADLETWGCWFETNDRTVARTELSGKLISTVFLGLNHNFSEEGPPEIFEPMVFNAGSWSELMCLRCATWDEAVAQHELACESVRSGRLSETN